jgi:hypothetical protein
MGSQITTWTVRREEKFGDEPTPRDALQELVTRRRAFSATPVYARTGASDW